MLSDEKVGPYRYLNNRSWEVSAANYTAQPSGNCSRFKSCLLRLAPLICAEPFAKQTSEGFFLTVTLGNTLAVIIIAATLYRREGASWLKGVLKVTP